jgi:hypothetical protein
MSETGTVRIFIPDPTHGEGGWSEASIAAMEGPAGGPSALFRQELEAEYGEKFRFESIGTGAAMASYFVELVSDPYRAAVTFFFAGKALKEGFQAWGWMYGQLSKFFHHRPTFDREGAAALVYKAIVEKLDGVPNSHELKGFATQHRLRYPDPSKDLPDPGPLTTIEPDRDRVERAVVYVFQVKADGRDFRVTVDGHNVKFLQQ